MAAKPNILILMADQMSAPFLPFYADSPAKLPTLSRLAEEGVLFTSAYSNSPLCGPARYTMQAGQLPSALGAYDNACELTATTPCMAHYLRKGGYRTMLAGKMHFVGPDQLHGFEERLTTDIYPADFGWTPDYRNYKPYNVSRYRGARKNLVPDGDILTAGYGLSELRILKANALKESGGAFGAINTWDDQIVSWGMAQFAGHAGTLAALLADLKDDARTRAAYQRYFAANGIDVAYGAYPWKQTTKTGWHVVVAAPEGPRRGDDGWNYIRTQPRLIGAFLLAGNDASLQLGQMLFWRRAFLLKAISKVIGRKDDGTSKGAAVLRYLTSERGLALIVRLHNWMPVNVVSWSNRFLAELQKRHTAAEVYDPGSWDVFGNLEAEFSQMLADERKRVKSGSYDTYALDLSRNRGSYVGQRSSV